MTRDDIWMRLAKLTPARIALGRRGSGMPTHETLRFALAHAQARDAVHEVFDKHAMAEQIRSLGLEAVEVASSAESRQSYLLRPDLGRTLSTVSVDVLMKSCSAPAYDISITVADGLSARAAHARAVPLLLAFRPYLQQHGWTVAPVVIASQARVALGDQIGACFNARLSMMLIGERPGLSSPDSLGIYLTFDPRLGRADAERNCISNIHSGGLSPPEAAYRAAWLIGEAFKRRLTGVGLKDESGKMLYDGRDPLLPDPNSRS
jgi:ethanolamine ammonia-lyase small subunit